MTHCIASARTAWRGQPDKNDHLIAAMGQHFHGHLLHIVAQRLVHTPKCACRMVQILVCQWAGWYAQLNY